MYRILIILISAIGLSLSTRAQDAHLSMYDAAPLFLNPALTGIVDGDFRLHGQYRTQWKSVNYKPYTTYLLSFDMPFKKWGFGVQVNQFRAGQGNYNSLQGLVSAAYNTALDKNKNHMISFGVQGGGVQKSLEYPLLSFNNQYSPNNGGFFDETIATGEDIEARTIYLPSVNAGLMYYFAQQNRRLNPFIGVSAFNLVSAKESFQGIDNRLPMRFYAHIGTRINLTETFYLIPKFLFMQQENFSEQTIALEAGYYLKNSELYLLGGLIYRNKDAAAITIGGKLDRFTLKLAYDINMSTLSTASSGRGGFEASLTYVHSKRRNKDFEKICPRL
ncbi:PorP/SprF family type IX secretion system membrane protein [Brumimicrobium sp.]|uniref:PorP/SprF family type IX secretion system membrane protein n=1 Tax=Brumimicrobium sp. TaxID=2029867 RepID=UPI003A8F94AE